MFPELDNELHRVTFMLISLHRNDNLVPEIYILYTQEMFSSV